MPDPATTQLKKDLEKHKVLSCVVARDGEIVFEHYKNAKIPSRLQTINSVTKSFTGALVGICIDRGLIPGVPTPLTEYFGDILARDPDSRKREITLFHLLTMSAGLDWPEFGEWHFFAPMVYSDDIVRFVLGRDLETAPGERMNYNSGCSQLLGWIIQQVTGGSVAEFATEALFRPLGISEFKWYDLQGQNLTADGLRLKTLDLVKFGSLYLNNGAYDNRQLISPSWIAESTKPIYHTYAAIGSYGYHWWVSSATTEAGDAVPFYFALGYQGQYIIVVPTLQMVAAITARLENTMAPLEPLKTFIASAN